MAAMAVRGRIHDGPVSKFVCNILVYLCAKFRAFMKKCTIGLILAAVLILKFIVIAIFGQSEGILKWNGGMIVTSRDKSKCDISN